LGQARDIFWTWFGAFLLTSWICQEVVLIYSAGAGPRQLVGPHIHHHDHSPLAATNTLTRSHAHTLTPAPPLPLTPRPRPLPPCCHQHAHMLTPAPPPAPPLPTNAPTHSAHTAPCQLHPRTPPGLHASGSGSGGGSGGSPSECGGGPGE
jgi:hypothetical protein